MLPPRRSPPRPQPNLVVIAAVLTAIISAAVCAAAILAPAPAAAVPLVVAVCVGCPMFAGWSVPLAVGTIRAERADGDAVAELRRSLDQLPEVEHPLDL